MNKRRIILVSAVLVAFICISFGYYCTVRVDRSAEGRILRDPSGLRGTRVGLVLGCSAQLADGRPNPFFESRMDAAARVLKSGKVSRLLLSGDNHKAGYDEPTWMKEALLARGVSASSITLDYAGFSTFDSLIRARDVFGLRELTVVTQERHAKRAIFIAGQLGLSAEAYAARSIGGGFGLRESARETLARARAVLDTTILHRRPRFLGHRIEIAGRPSSQVVGDVRKCA